MTDFLAANNISAAQILAQAAAQQQAAQQATQQQTAQQQTADQRTAQNGEINQGEIDEAEADEKVETSLQRNQRLRKEKSAIKKIKESKSFQKRRAYMGLNDSDADDAEARNLYAKTKALPGQIENCEICEKRFTVTAYSKTGPSGGLLCPKCSKEQEAAKKKDAKPKKQDIRRDKRRKVQSNLLDGIVRSGAKTLLELCVDVSIPPPFLSRSSAPASQFPSLSLPSLILPRLPSSFLPPSPLLPNHLLIQMIESCRQYQ